MKVKQISIFLENRSGRLFGCLSVLSEAGINVVSASLADTNDFGILRILVSDTEKAVAVLKEHHIIAKVTDVIAIVVPNAIGSLAKVLDAIDKAGINISYMYGLSVTDDGATIAIKTSDIDATIKALEPLNLKYFSDEELSKF